MGTQLGILTATNLPKARAALGAPVDHVGALVELAERFHHRQVLVHASAIPHLFLPEDIPDADPSRRAREGIPHAFVGSAMGDYTTWPAGLSHFLVASRAGSERRTDVHFLSWDHQAGLEHAEPRDALAALEAYATLMGIPYRWSPGATGTALMLRGRRTRLGRSTVDPPAPALEGGTEADYYWLRPLDLTERTAAHVHAFDCNGRYLAACSSVELGLGEPDHLIPTRAETLGFDPRKPGYWRTTMRPWNAGTPAPWDALERSEPGEPAWYATPTVELAGQLGHVGTIHEAYVWPEHSRYLAPWYDTLRTARAAAMGLEPPVGPLVLGLLKRTYVVAIGYLAAHFRAAGDELYRPDWRHQVIATARANLTRRISRMETAPFAIDVDAVYVASNGSPEEAARGLPLGPELGSYKHAGSCSMADALGAMDDEDPLRQLGRLVKGGR